MITQRGLPQAPAGSPGGITSARPGGAGNNSARGPETDADGTVQSDASQAAGRGDEGAGFDSHATLTPMSHAISVGVFPLLSLGTCCSREDNWTPCAVLPTNVRSLQGPRLSCRDQKDNMLLQTLDVNLRAFENNAPTVLSGSPYQLTVTSFEHVRPPARATRGRDSVHFGLETGAPWLNPWGEEGAVVVASASVETFRSALHWLGAGTLAFEVKSAEEGLRLYLKKLEESVCPLFWRVEEGCTDKQLLDFCTDRKWDEVEVPLWNNDKLDSTIEREDFCFLRRFVAKNLPRAARVVGSPSDGVHRIAVARCIATCVVPPNACRQLKEQVKLPESSLHLQSKVNLVTHCLSGPEHEDFLHRMKFVSRESQRTLGKGVPHGFRVYFRLFFERLGSLAKAKDVPWLIDSNGTLRHDVSGDKEVTGWVQKISELILQVLNDLSAGPLAVKDINAPRTQEEKAKFLLLFSRAGRDRAYFKDPSQTDKTKYFHIFPFGVRDQQLSYFVESRSCGHYNANRYSKRPFKALMCQFVQVMLWSRLSDSVSTKIRELICIDDPTEDQATCGCENDTLRWFQAFVHVVASCVFRAESLYIKPSQRAVALLLHRSIDEPLNFFRKIGQASTTAAGSPRAWFRTLRDRCCSIMLDGAMCTYPDRAQKVCDYVTNKARPITDYLSYVAELHSLESDRQNAAAKLCEKRPEFKRQNLNEEEDGEHLAARLGEDLAALLCMDGDPQDIDKFARKMGHEKSMKEQTHLILSAMTKKYELLLGQPATPQKKTGSTSKAVSHPVCAQLEKEQALALGKVLTLVARGLKSDKVTDFRNNLTAFLLSRPTLLIEISNVELRAYLAVTCELV